MKLTRYFNRPNYPQGNGQVERSFRTDEESRPVGAVQPHQALGYKTPDEFYHDWPGTYPSRKEVLSDMS